MQLGFLCKLIIIRLSLVGCNMTKAAEVTVEYIVQFWSILYSYEIHCTEWSKLSIHVLVWFAGGTVVEAKGDEMTR